MNFTNSPYEREMKEKPHPEDAVAPGIPDNSKCKNCPYWRGIKCVSCYRDLMRRLQSGR